MRTVIPGLLFLATIASAADSEADKLKRWKSCDKDDSCIAILGPCNSWQCFNSKSRKEVEAWVLVTSAEVKCLLQKEPPKPVGKCESGECLCEGQEAPKPKNRY